MERKRKFLIYKEFLQPENPVESISFSHLLSILLLHLHRHLLLVVILPHLLSQFLHLFLQIPFLRHQLSHFLLHIDETLWGGKEVKMGIAAKT